MESFAGQNSINAQIQLLFFLASTIKRLILLGSLFLPAPQKQMAKAHTQLYLGYTKPIRDNVKYWHGSKIRVLCFKSLIYWWSFSRNHGNDVQLLFVHPVRVSDCYFSYSLIQKSNVRFHYWVNVPHSTNWRKVQWRELSAKIF